MDMQPFLDDVTNALIGRRGLVCPGCKSFAVAHPGLDMEREQLCTEGHTFYPGEEWAEMLPEFAPLIDDNVVDASTFYHVTNRENWYENLPFNRPLHIGSKRAAFERYYNSLSFGDMRNNSEWSLYSVRIQPDAFIHPQLWADSDEWNETIPFLSLLSNQPLPRGIDVVRYVNEVEAPGSISLVCMKDACYIENVMSVEEGFADVWEMM